MSNDLARQYPFARETVAFFIEDMIVYVLRGWGIVVERRRMDRLNQRLRPIAILRFTPFIGETVMETYLTHRDRVTTECMHIWDYIRVLRPYARGDVLFSSIVAMAMRLTRNRADILQIYILMAVVADLARRFYQNGEVPLIYNCVDALEHVFNHTLSGGAMRVVFRISNYALRQVGLLASAG